MITTTQAAAMSAAELRGFALTCTNRQESLFATRYAEAKDAAIQGDAESAQRYLEAAKVSYSRALKAEHDQLALVRTTQAVVEANDAALDASAPGGKLVNKIFGLRGVATWSETWARTR